jgi:hypothetical protein
VIGEIRDGKLIRGTYVGEIGGVVKVYFAIMDDELLEDYADDLRRILAYLRESVDGDGLVLWDEVAPVVWRPATRDEYDTFVQANPVDGIEHLVCGFSLPTVPGRLCIN